jgi:hypothetical protein
MMLENSPPTEKKAKQKAPSMIRVENRDTQYNDPI